MAPSLYQGNPKAGYDNRLSVHRKSSLAGLAIKRLRDFRRFDFRLLDNQLFLKPPHIFSAFQG